jgi:hypothetical protein
MKRALFPLLTAGLIAAQAGWTANPPDLLPWLNGARGALPRMSEDRILMETAQAYASLLASLGRISHTGPDGSDALTRYLRAGGTCARVGEIIGAGSSLLDIEKAWIGSPDHHAAIVKPYWTDVGWGMARAGEGEVWVVLFARKLVIGLAVREGEGGWTVGGTLRAHDAVRPVLLTGLSRLEPRAWDPLRGEFLFTVPSDLWTGYVRLGYVSEAGGLEVTDVLTSPRGTGYR